jgi:hypothetical protein
VRAIGRAIRLMLFGLAMIVLEFRAFSVPWSWTLAQDLFVLLGLSILLGALWARQRRELQASGEPVKLIPVPGGRHPRLYNLLLWMVISAVLVVAYNLGLRS